MVWVWYQRVPAGVGVNRYRRLPCGGTAGVPSSSDPSTSEGMSNPWKCTNSGTSVLLTTFTVTGTPSFIRSRGPGEVPLYPMVLMMRLGANSTVTGPISSVKSVFAASVEPAGARRDCSCWPSSRPLAAPKPAILRKSRRCMRDEKTILRSWYRPIDRRRRFEKPGGLLPRHFVGIPCAAIRRAKR